MAIIRTGQAVFRFTESDSTDISDQLMVDCVIAICQTFFRRSRTLVVSGTNFSVVKENLLEGLHRIGDWPIVVSETPPQVVERDPLVWDTRNDDKHHAYILLVTEMEKVAQHLQHLETFSAWNSWVKFVVVLDFSPVNKKTVEETFWEMGRRKIHNVVVLTKDTKPDNDTVSEISIRTWFPYALPKVCDRPQNSATLDSWILSGTQGTFRYNTSLFPNKIPADLQGYPVRVGTTDYPPFVILENVKAGRIDGIDMRILHCLAEHLNFTFEILPNFESYPWGLRLPNGTWAGMCRDLLYNQIDVAVAGWYDNFNDHLAFEVSQPYYTDIIMWYVPRARPFPHWMGIIRVFSPSFWVVFLLAITASSIFLRVISLNLSSSDCDSARYTSALKCSLDLWSMIISTAVPVLPHTGRFRLFFGCWVIYSIAINTIFQTYMTSLLVDPGFQHQISDVEEFVDHDLEFFFNAFLFSFVDSNMIKHLVPLNLFSTHFTCFQNAVKSKKAVTALSKAFVENLANEQVRNNKTFHLVELAENYISFYLVFLFKKGDPLVESFNEVILRLVEAGLPAQFTREITSYVKKHSEDYIIEYIALSMDHLFSAFILLLVGLTSSSLVFIVEVSVTYIGHRFSHEEIIFEL